MDMQTMRFAVIYRWKIRTGKEESFRQAWETVTLDLKEKRGALGSRLHIDEEGVWVAYAQWPSRDSWARSRELGPIDEEAAKFMTEAIEESFAPILLNPVRDLLDRR